MSIELVNLDEVLKVLRDLPEERFEVAKRAFGKARIDAQKEVSDNLQTKMRNRTGSLSRSIKTSLKGTTIKDLSASLFTDSKYAPTHEYGATIRAKRAYARVQGGPYLNIPLRANLYPSGVMRYSARDVFEKGGTIRRYRGLNFGVFLDGQMMFKLQKQVKIKARLGMRKAADNQIPTLLSRLVEAAE